MDALPNISTCKSWPSYQRMKLPTRSWDQAEQWHSLPSLSPFSKLLWFILYPFPDQCQTMYYHWVSDGLKKIWSDTFLWTIVENMTPHMLNNRQETRWLTRNWLGFGFTQTQSRLTLSLLEKHVAEYTPKTRQLEETHMSATKQLEEKEF